MVRLLLGLGLRGGDAGAHVPVERGQALGALEVAARLVQVHNHRADGRARVAQDAAAAACRVASSILEPEPPTKNT